MPPKKTPALPAVKAPAAKKTPAKKAVPPVKKASAVKAEATAQAPASKDKKMKLVRDSFTIPKAEFAVLDVLKLRAAKMDAPVKKTELLRAGIKALAAMSDKQLLDAVRAVPNLKTGRPAKAK